MSNLSNLTPLVGKDQPVEWFFAFKFNCASFPGCTDDGVTPVVGSTGIFGGVVEPYKNGHSQQYVFATDQNPTLVKGTECLGSTLNDPLGATFNQVYNSDEYNYVVWNDQFYNDPMETLAAPWGHSKGMLAWDNNGDGFVLQTSTPSWPASGNFSNPRKTDGNTLGCINDDDIEVSQHMFCLKINKDDLVIMLKAIDNASVVTNPTIPQIVKNGGPDDVQALVDALGKENKSTSYFKATLSSGVQILSKPSKMDAPVWQLVSAQLGGVPLRVASWWTAPEIGSTNSDTIISCWPANFGQPGDVEIALNGNWNGTELGFLGGPHPTGNHSKVGVSTDPSKPYSIFGDMNQQGTLDPVAEKNGKTSCAISQNGRGGLFYVVENQELFESITSLLAGDTAPLAVNTEANAETETV